MTCSDLSILCVTKGEDCILPLLSRMINQAQSIDAEIVLAVDGHNNYERLKSHFTELASFRIEFVESRGYIESVLDEAVDLTSREYVFRLDDDESMPDELIIWLYKGEYRSHPHWKFNRAHLWRDEKTVITNPPLWADHQTRLSTRALSYGRTSIHCGSPFGGGELAPYPIIHHKFLVKSLLERQDIVRKYDQVQSGMGYNFRVFSVPELVIPESEIKTSSLEFMIGYSLLIWAGY